jgi:hypothetical protein
MQFLSMFLSDYLKEDQDKELSKDLKYFQDNANVYRRLIRLFNFVVVASEIQLVARSSKISDLRFSLLLSKASIFVYFVMDSVLTLKLIQKGSQVRELGKTSGIMRFWRYGYIFRLVSVLSSAMFYTGYLRKSYQTEISLRNELPENLTPQDVLLILKSLTHERRIIYLKIFKMISEFFIVVHFTGIAERVFFVKFERMVIGLIGLFSAALEMYIAQAAKRCELANEIVKIC